MLPRLQSIKCRQLVPEKLPSELTAFSVEKKTILNISNDINALLTDRFLQSVWSGFLLKRYNILFTIL